MTVQKIYSRTNPVHASENPSGKTVAQVDEALRDFVLQDTAHLRREAETELGIRFDVRAFHAQVLDSGALPLAVLEDKVHRWIAREKSR